MMIIKIIKQPEVSSSVTKIDCTLCSANCRSTDKYWWSSCLYEYNQQ